MRTATQPRYTRRKQRLHGRRFFRASEAYVLVRGEFADDPRGRFGRLAKRAFDIAVSAVAIVVLAPVFLLLGLLVALESGWPVFFGHRRVGRRGRIFKCWKFRTMRKDAEELLRNDPDLYDIYVANNYKLPLELDPRVTRVGRFLRKTSLDELPQFFNVLVGEMSLVGPRPVIPEELEWYGEKAGEFLSVRPGITGRWQVMGRSRIGYPERVEVELDGIRRGSFWSDLAVLLQTVRAVWTARGSL
jgi:exopolysaccharide production protein ExoY